MNEQAKTAILARNESLTAAFVNRTSDGIFLGVGRMHAPDQYDKDVIKLVEQGMEHEEAEDAALHRCVWRGYEVLTGSLYLDI